MAINNPAWLNRPEIIGSLFDKMSLDRAISGADSAAYSLLNFPAADGVELTARIFEGSGDGPVILYFPAEYETIETLLILGEGFKIIGFNMISLDYRGLGLSKGSFSFDKAFEDAVALHGQAANWMKETGHKGGLALMGRSIGTVFALDLALRIQQELLCLIMESAFDSGRTFLIRKGIDVDLIEDGPIFENRKKMARLEKPVLFIHSPKDEIQSLTEVEWLVAESRSKATQFQIAPSGTREELAYQVNEVYMETLQLYVNLRRGIKPPRRRRRPVKWSYPDS